MIGPTAFLPPDPPAPLRPRTRVVAFQDLRSQRDLRNPSHRREPGVHVTGSVQPGFQGSGLCFQGWHGGWVAFVKCPSVVFDMKGRDSENHRVPGPQGARPVIWEETEAEWQVTCLPYVAVSVSRMEALSNHERSPKNGGAQSWRLPFLDRSTCTHIFMEYLPGGKNWK